MKNQLFNYLFSTILIFFSFNTGTLINRQFSASAQVPLPSTEAFNFAQCVGQALATYMNTVNDEFSGNTNISVGTPAINCTSETCSAILYEMWQAGADFSNMDALVMNVYNIDGNSITDWLTEKFNEVQALDPQLAQILSQVPLVLSEVGLRDPSVAEEFHQSLIALTTGTYPPSGQLSFGSATSTTPQVYIFNPDGNNPQFLNQQQYYCNNGYDCNQWGNNIAGDIESGAALPACQSGPCVVIANNPSDLTAAINLIQNSPSGNVLIRACYADNCGFTNPQTYIDFINQLNSAICTATNCPSFGIIAGPNEPDIEPWAAPQCGTFLLQLLSDQQCVAEENQPLTSRPARCATCETFVPEPIGSCAGNIIYERGLRYTAYNTMSCGPDFLQCSINSLNCSVELGNDNTDPEALAELLENDPGKVTNNQLLVGPINWQGRFQLNATETILPFAGNDYEESRERYIADYLDGTLGYTSSIDPGFSLPPADQDPAGIYDRNATQYIELPPIDPRYWSYSGIVNKLAPQEFIDEVRLDLLARVNDEVFDKTYRPIQKYTIRTWQGESSNLGTMYESPFATGNLDAPHMKPVRSNLNSSGYPAALQAWGLSPSATFLEALEAYQKYDGGLWARLWTRIPLASKQDTPGQFNPIPQSPARIQMVGTLADGGAGQGENVPPPGTGFITPTPVNTPTPTPTPSQLLTGQIKAMSFNTGPNRSTLPERYSEALIIAEFVKQQQIEIVGLQERIIVPGSASDGELLEQAFNEVNYPMYLIQVQGDGEHESNIIASKYPFVSGTYAEHMINGRNRVMQRVAVQTPYQAKLWVVNLHTNAAKPNNPCDQAAEALQQTRDTTKQFSVPENEAVIVLGDFNVWMYHNGEIGGCNWDNRIHDEIQFYNVQCQDPNKCYQLNNNIDDNGETRNIDWIITTKSSKTIIKSTWTDPTIKYVGDGHPVLLGLIESPTFITPTPTPTPSLNPNSSLKVASWNIGTVSSRPAALRTARMQQLANIITRDKFDIVYLQEFYGAGDNGVNNDLRDLLSQLNANNYPMYSNELYYEPNNRFAQLVILSKYPFNQASLRTNPKININTSSRVAQSIISQTPIGNIRLSNIHTHYHEMCSQYLNYLNFYEPFDPEITLMAGDVNLPLDEPPFGPLKYDGCDSMNENIDRYNISCENPNICIDGSSTENDKTIDWFILFKNSKLIIESSQQFDRFNPAYSGIADSHPIIISTIKLKKPPTPTPTPPAQPNPTAAGNCSTYPVFASAPPTKAGDNYKLMTFNVMSTDFDLSSGRTLEQNRNQLLRIANAIVEQSLDFVFLQEMDHVGEVIGVNNDGDEYRYEDTFSCLPPSTDAGCCIDSPDTDTFNRFDVIMSELSRLNYPMYFQNIDYQQNGYSTRSGSHRLLTTLSRYPITNVSKYFIDFDKDGDLDRPILQTDVTIGTKVVKFYNVHTPINLNNINGVFETLTGSSTGQFEYNFLSVGDYNLEPRFFNHPGHQYLSSQVNLVDSVIYRTPTSSQGFQITQLSYPEYNDSILNPGKGITFEGHQPLFVNLNISKIPTSTTNLNRPKSNISQLNNYDPYQLTPTPSILDPNFASSQIFSPVLSSSTQIAQGETPQPEINPGPGGGSTGTAPPLLDGTDGENIYQPLPPADDNTSVQNAPIPAPLQLPHLARIFESQRLLNRLLAPYDPKYPTSASTNTNSNLSEQLNTYDPYQLTPTPINSNKSTFASSTLFSPLSSNNNTTQLAQAYEPVSTTILAQTTPIGQSVPAQCIDSSLAPGCLPDPGYREDDYQSGNGNIAIWMDLSPQIQNDTLHYQVHVQQTCTAMPSYHGHCQLAMSGTGIPGPGAGSPMAAKTAPENTVRDSRIPDNQGEVPPAFGIQPGSSGQITAYVICRDSGLSWSPDGGSCGNREQQVTCSYNVDGLGNVTSNCSATAPSIPPPAPICAPTILGSVPDCAGTLRTGDGDYLCGQQSFDLIIDQPNETFWSSNPYQSTAYPEDGGESIAGDCVYDFSSNQCGTQVTCDSCICAAPNQEVDLQRIDQSTGIVSYTTKCCGSGTKVVDMNGNEDCADGPSNEAPNCCPDDEAPNCAYPGGASACVAQPAGSTENIIGNTPLPDQQLIYPAQREVHIATTLPYLGTIFQETIGYPSNNPNHDPEIFPTFRMFTPYRGPETTGDTVPWYGFHDGDASGTYEIANLGGPMTSINGAIAGVTSDFFFPYLGGIQDGTQFMRDCLTASYPNRCTPSNPGYSNNYYDILSTKTCTANFNKMSFFVNQVDNDLTTWITQKQPTVIKLFENSLNEASNIKSISPQTKIVGRKYLDKWESIPGEYNTSNLSSARQAAQDWCDDMGGCNNLNASIDYWEGINEPVVENAERMLWLAEFEAERIRLLNGKACIANFSTGNPDVTLWPNFQAAFDQAQSSDAVICLHEYATATTTVDGFRMGRFDDMYDYLASNNNSSDDDIQTIISETGASATGASNSGWRKIYNDDPERFLEVISEYDQFISSKPNILGATLFIYNHPGWPFQEMKPEIIEAFTSGLSSNTPQGDFVCTNNSNYSRNPDDNYPTGPAVTVGQVNRGDIIGFNANIGYPACSSANGTHLHFVIYDTNYPGQSRTSSTPGGFYQHPGLYLNPATLIGGQPMYNLSTYGSRGQRASFQWPADNPILWFDYGNTAGTGYGFGSWHNGIDLNPRQEGIPIRAVDDGILERGYSTCTGSNGLTSDISRAAITLNNGIIAIYNHLSWE